MKKLNHLSLKINNENVVTIYKDYNNIQHEEFSLKYKDLKIILTGGDHSFFADHLKSSIFAAPDLTLWGLNKILQYNVR